MNWDRSGWRIDHACPQCGGPVSLEETDHLLACPFCRVNFYMVSQEDSHHYYLPAKNPDRENMFYAPYRRFKGVLYSCPPYQVKNRNLDATVLAVKAEGLPQSLGLRPQAMPLRFVQPDLPGKFLQSAVSFEEALLQVEYRLKILDDRDEKSQPFYTSFFGRTTSVIHAPFFLQDGRLFDGILEKPLPGPGRPPALDALPDRPGWEVKFVPALCPGCGWDLLGDKNALVMACGNCRSAWETTTQGLRRTRFLVLPHASGDPVYLPFWRIRPKASGLNLSTFADFIRITNLPKAPQPEWDRTAFHFWLPAINFAPQIFMRFSRNATAFQPQAPKEEASPPTSLAPATLAASDAAQSLKTVLAEITQAKRVFLPRLPEIEISSAEHVLVWVPFFTLGRELVNREMQLSINRALVGLDS